MPFSARGCYSCTGYEIPGGMGVMLAAPGREVRRSRRMSAALKRRLHSKAKELLHEIVEAPTRKDAGRALEVFREEYGAKYPKTLA